MAKIREANPKTTSGGYNRIFGNDQVGKLIQKVQSTVISSGTELEKIITERSNKVDNLDDFIEQCSKRIITNGTFLCPKSVIFNSKYRLQGHEPDLLIFKLDYRSGNQCIIIELKDGDNFDTKKSAREKESLIEYRNSIGSKLPFITTYYICSFNQIDKDEIVKGFKNKFDKDEVLTGKQFCSLLNLNYDEIVDYRKKDQNDNLDYFISEFIKIDVVNNKILDKFKSKIKSKLSNKISEDDFYDNKTFELITFLSTNKDNILEAYNCDNELIYLEKESSINDLKNILSNSEYIIINGNKEEIINMLLSNNLINDKTIILELNNQFEIGENQNILSFILNE